MKPHLLAAGAAVAAALASVAAAAPAADVTLSVDRFYDAGNFVWRQRFTGVISPAAANEYVAVMGHRCGSPFATAVAVAGASTRADGSWEVVPGNPVVVPPATYRARWNDRLSEPVTIRTTMNQWFERLPGRRYRISVGGAQMRGRIVELQRLSGGRWTRVRTARLLPNRHGTFSATFTVRTRGLTMRILLPPTSVGPCFLETATKAWRS